MGIEPYSYQEADLLIMRFLKAATKGTGIRFSAGEVRTLDLAGMFGDGHATMERMELIQEEKNQ